MDDPRMVLVVAVCTGLCLMSAIYEKTPTERARGLLCGLCGVLWLVL